jgi:hypothetical protein
MDAGFSGDGFSWTFSWLFAAKANPSMTTIKVMETNAVLVE